MVENEMCECENPARNITLLTEVVQNLVKVFHTHISFVNMEQERFRYSFTHRTPQSLRFENEMLKGA